MTLEHTVGNSIVLQTVPDSLQPLIDGFLGAIPLVVGALIILLLGWIVGRVLGGVVKRLVGRIGPAQYADETPLEREGDTDRNIAQSLGDLTKYVVYLLALLAALSYVGIGVPGGFLTGVAGGVVQVVVAIAILIVGIAIGRFVGGLVEDIVSGFGLDSFVRGTPLDDATDAVGGIGNAVGRLVEFLIYYFALVAAIDALDFPALSEPLTAFIGQIPLLIGGLAVLVVGIYVADVFGDIVSSADAGRAADIAGLAVQLFVYYIVIVFALDTAGFDTAVLTTLFASFVTALFGALGLAAAIAIGVGLGWGSKDYVAENIYGWMSSARSSASDMTDERESGRRSSGGSDTLDDSDTFDDDDSGPSSPGRTGGSGPSGD